MFGAIMRMQHVQVSLHMRTHRKSQLSTVVVADPEAEREAHNHAYHFRQPKKCSTRRTLRSVPGSARRFCNVSTWLGLMSVSSSYV